MRCAQLSRIAASRTLTGLAPAAPASRLRPHCAPTPTPTPPPPPQNKQPLMPADVFQDVPSDHAFKTMTMESFPPSGQLLASVHPCKHASVMKKFIDRMDAAQKGGSGAGGGAGAGAGSAPPAPQGKGDEKRKWGIGKMVRKVTGGVQTGSQAAAATGSGGSSQGAASKPEGEPADETGLQVDFYLVIVR